MYRCRAALFSKRGASTVLAMGAHLVLLSSVTLFAAGCTSNTTPNPAVAREVGNPGGLPSENSHETVEKRYRAQEEILKRQKEEAARQDREIQELKLQQYQNEYLERYE